MKKRPELTNGDLAELLARAAEEEAGIPHERILNFQSREDVLAWAAASRGLGR